MRQLPAGIVQMPYTFTLTTTIPASARQIYDAWLDSLGHSEMTGSKADMSNEVGADVSAWGGYITGRNLELTPGERIVQSWRTAQFLKEYEDSIITVTLESTKPGRPTTNMTRRTGARGQGRQHSLR